MEKRKYGLVNHLQKSVSPPAYIFKMVFHFYLGREIIKLSSWGSKLEQKPLAYCIHMCHIISWLPFWHQCYHFVEDLSEVYFQENCSLPLTHITSYQAGKLFSSWHGLLTGVKHTGLEIV